MRDLAERARQLGNKTYPHVILLLADPGSKLPQRFDVVFEKHLRIRNFVGYDAAGRTDTKAAKIYLGAEYFAQDTNDFFDGYFVHEMAHLAQQYTAKAPDYWVEGIADYVRFKLGYTNGWICPQCSTDYPHYTSGYACAGAFLLFVDTTYDSNVVRQLSMALRQDSYSQAFFMKTTGKSLDELWAEFQKAPAYTPIASRVFRLQQSLGYVNGHPPKDVQSRVMAYIQQQPGGALTLEAEEFFEDQAKKGLLPGFRKGAHGSCSYDWNALLEMQERSSSEADPVARTVSGWMDGDPSTYHYTFMRASRNNPWKLQKAWRTAPDKHVIEEYVVE